MMHYLYMCAFTWRLSAADRVLVFFFFPSYSPPPTLFCCGQEPLYGSFFVFGDVVWLCSKMKCLCCLGASPAGWDQVTDGTKVLCLYHCQVEELHSGVAHQFWINRGAWCARSAKQLVCISSVCLFVCWVGGCFVERFNYILWIWAKNGEFVRNFLILKVLFYSPCLLRRTFSRASPEREIETSGKAL